MPQYFQLLKDALSSLKTYAATPEATCKQALNMYVPIATESSMEITIFPHLWGEVVDTHIRTAEAQSRTKQMKDAICAFQTIDAGQEERLAKLTKHLALFRFKPGRITEPVCMGTGVNKVALIPEIRQWIEQGASPKEKTALLELAQK